MSNRIDGFYVALKKDLKEEDFLNIKNAVLMIKNVIGVTENVLGIDEYVQRERIKREYRDKLYDLFFREPDDFD